MTLAVTASPLLKLSLDDWERIAFHVVASENTFLGPPSALCALSLVSRQIHDAISVQGNSRLYARIFRFKFDYAAPERRLTERWLTTRCLAAETIKRFTALKRIRRRQEFNPDDLWTCYLMMSESDGKNESQLCEWANLNEYLRIMIAFRARPSTVSWYEDPVSDSLMAWLMWMSISRDNIRTEHPDMRTLTAHLLHPFLTAGYQHPSAYAPDSYFHLPLCAEQDSISPRCSGPPPPVETVIHYSHQLILAVPLVTSAAVLVATVQIEAHQDADSHPRSAMSLPPNRPAADALGVTGPTLDDVLEFHYRTRIHLPQRCSPLINTLFEQESKEEKDGETSSTSPLMGSNRYDEDWSRLVSCYDPWTGGTPLRGKVFRIGSLCGSWAGRFLQPNFDAHMTLVLNSQTNPASIPLHHQPLYWNLREHHCLNPDQPVLAGTDAAGGDDILSAWLPRGIVVKSLEDAIEVFDPNTERTARYETFLPRSTAPYSKLACEKMERPWIFDDSDEEIADNDADSDFGSTDLDPMPLGTSNIDDDDEYADTVCHQSSGVSDILVTGESGQRHGDAWGHYTIIGRVRPWDGYIVLLRTPRDPNQSHLGQWIFRGYIHDRNFVGRWRETTTPVGMVGFEGGFVVYKTEES